MSGNNESLSDQVLHLKAQLRDQASRLARGCCGLCITENDYKTALRERDEARELAAELVDDADEATVAAAKLLTNGINALIERDLELDRAYWRIERLTEQLAEAEKHRASAQVLRAARDSEKNRMERDEELAANNALRQQIKRLYRKLENLEAVLRG